MIFSSKKYKILITFVFFIFLALPHTGYTQKTIPSIEEKPYLSQDALSISPFIIEEQMEKGQTIERKIEIRNISNKPLPITMSINDFVPAGTKGQVRFLDTNEQSDEKFSLTSWINVTEQPKFIIPPLGLTTVKFSITAPIGAEPGTHYGGLLFSYNDQTIVPGGSKVTQKLGALVIINLGKADEQGKITNFEVNKDWQTAKDLEFNFIFQNTGKTRLIPKGEIDIRNIFGKSIGHAYINRDGNMVLPRGERNFVTKLEKPFLFGYYTADGWVQFGNPLKEERVSMHFWFFPTRLIGILIGVLALLIPLIIFVIKRYNKRLLKKAGIE